MAIIQGTSGTDLLKGGPDDDTIYGLESNDSLEGLGGNDIIDGGSGSDLLSGGDGNDKLLGGSGSDILSGNGGADTLTGGTEADFFRDTAAGLNGDTITDLSVGDHIQITDLTTANANLGLTATGITFAGGSLTLNGLGPGRLIISTITGGGVDIRLDHTATNDFNGDGISDVLWRSDSGEITDWLGESNGRMVSNFANADHQLDPSWHVAGTGDFNGDGRADIVWRNESGEVTDWFGQANGSFVSNYGNFNSRPGNDWHIAGVADFNGDGRDDILWRNDSGEITDWLATPNGSFASNLGNADHFLDNSWHVAATGDFNGDGRGDIVWRNDSGEVTNWVGQPDGSFLSNYGNFNSRPGLDWHVVGTGDFNGDGNDDILWRSDAGEVTNWLGQSGLGFNGNFGNSYAILSTAWHVAEIGDFNGDGIDDILWRNDNGDVTNWLGQSNGSFVANSPANAHVDTTWHVQPPEVFV